jgi:hypothetical protein
MIAYMLGILIFSALCFATLIALAMMVNVVINCIDSALEDRKEK